ncbi:hypothetical protein KM043_013652 [Ampulex compressa]|nr:hypothetical protein KM043_013652 [Ampulex compressa]
MGFHFLTHATCSIVNIGNLGLKVPGAAGVTAEDRRGTVKRSRTFLTSGRRLDVVMAINISLVRRSR